MSKVLSDLCSKVLNKNLIENNFLYTFVLFPTFADSHPNLVWLSK